MGELIKSDEELAAIENEALAETQVDAPEAEIDTGFEIEIVDPEMYGKGKSDELVAAEAEMAKLKEAVANKESSAAQTQALLETMETVKALQTQLSGGIKVEKEAETPTPFDLKAHNAKFDKEVWNNPSKAVGEYLNPLIGNLSAQIAELSTSMQQAKGQSELLMNESDRDFYIKYKDEVDTAAKNKSYTDALKEVKYAHIDDLIAEKVAAATASAPKTQAQPQFTNTGVPAAPKVATKVQMTPGMQRFATAMRNKGIADEEYILERAQEEKKAGNIRD